MDDSQYRRGEYGVGVGVGMNVGALDELLVVPGVESGRGVDVRGTRLSVGVRVGSA